MEGPIRIALIRQRYTPFGGAERFVENVLNALQNEAEIELTLITRKWTGTENQKIRKIICNPFYIGRLWRDWSFARHVCRTVKHNNFDLVQSHERVPCCDIYRAGDGVHLEWLKQWGRIQPFWRRLGITLSPYHNYVLWQEKKLFNQSRLKNIITNSYLIKEEISRNFPLAGKKCLVIHNAVNTKRFSPNLRKLYRNTTRGKLDIPTSAKVLLFVGSGFDRKGVPFLLKLMEQLPNKNIHLIIVGKGRNQKKLQRQIHGSNLNKRIHFTGPQQDPRPYYGASDIFLFPSLYDPLPNTVLEAMACGLPVLVSTSCGAVDLVRNEKDGFSQDALDLTAWKQNTIAALQPELNRKLSERARTTATSLSTTKMVESMKKLYRDHLNNLSNVDHL